MRFIYADLWNDDRFFPVGELTEAQARERYVTGPQFDVAAVIDGHRSADRSDVSSVGDVNLFTLSIDPENEVGRCTRYNEVGSISEIYHYKRIDGRMFLGNITWYVYPDDLRRYNQLYALAHATYLLRPDGTGREAITVSKTAATGSGDPEDPLSTEGRRWRNFTDGRTDWLWEDDITFGDWERFGRPRLGEAAGSGPGWLPPS